VVQPEHIRDRKNRGSDRSGLAALSDAAVSAAVLENVTGIEVIDWIHEVCYVPEGKHVGKRIELQPWQCDIIKMIYDNPAVTRRAILSFGRKNGKTTLAAMLTLVHLCGPKARTNAQLFSAAQSRGQAALLYNLAVKIVRMSPMLRDVVLCRESLKELVVPELGSRYRALSAETKTSYGLSPVFIVHDELGQVRGPRSELYDALETATGAQQDPLSVVISTQAATDGDLLSVLIDDATAGHDPQTVCKVYTAPMDIDPFSEEAIAAANPALGTFLSKKEAMSMAADAKRVPSRESGYRNLILNQRIDTNAPFISPMVWKENASIPAPLDELELYGGLDLSEVRDLTALVLIGRLNGKWHVHPTFWLPDEGLKDKSIADRVPYDLWKSQGFLKTTPGKTISYEFVAKHLFALFNRYNIRRIAFDRWNIQHFRPWLLMAGFREQFIEDRFVAFGQGWQSMSPALRELDEAMTDHKVCHGDNPVLNMCASNSIVLTDDAGNRKLSKKKSVGRIDGMVALAMAVGVAPLKSKEVDIEALIG
jgi:phage terminase large subunit-like protein